MRQQLPPAPRNRQQGSARRTGGVSLPWIERAAIDYLRLGPQAVGFAELCRDEQRAVLRMAIELVIGRSPRRLGARRWRVA
jgi:hypothetical protein